MRYFIETGYVSLNKKGEELCGDRVETLYHEGTMTTVLADGMGSGVKANILSTLTSKIISTMMASGLSIADCVETIAQTLPICKVRQVAYSTFTILQIGVHGDAYMVQFDNPLCILLRDGKATDYPVEVNVIDGKTIYETRMQVQLGDVFVMFSDGVPHAGIGITMNLGWQQENVVKQLEEQFSPTDSAKSTAAKLAEVANALYLNEPGDDTTVAVMKVREKQTVSIMFGPPSDSKDDIPVTEKFLATDGIKIVSGGTTSKIVSKYLGSEIVTRIDYIDPKIPPIGSMKGVDLVSEGVLTLGHVMELSNMIVSKNNTDLSWLKKKDGASLIAQYLFEYATDVNFFVGRAMNPAHQNPNLPLDLSIKLKIVEVLSKNLELMGKRVNVEYH
ncbi:MAG TPA: SpoIIE family protein phosphatase [Candidatus Merdivicinus intestinigallinarum]|nr:SpoIIE family protein phosphatase [Candidatus Merdivicinus intestinigallinarum]